MTQQECLYFDNMEKIGIKHKHMFWIFSVCYFFDMMDMNLFGSIAASVQATFALTNEQISQLSSLSFYGMFFGGLLGGRMADKIGRKRALLYNVLIFSIASLGNALFNNYALFALCRFFTGFGIIGMNIIAMVYIAEMMPAHSRGKYQGLMAATGSLGIPFGIILSAAVVPRSPEAWRIMFLLGGLGIILFPIGLKWLYESPRWLVAKGRYEDADKIVETMSGVPSYLAKQGTACVDSKVSAMETLSFLFSKKQIGSTLALMIMAIGCVVGGFFMANWIVLILVQMGYDLQLVLAFSILGCFGSPLGDLISSKISDMGGRKIPIVIMLFLAATFCIISGLMPTIFAGTAAVAVAAYMITNLVRAACATGATTMYWTYLAENMPNKYRSTGTGLVMSVSRLLIGVVTPVVPIIMAMNGISPMFNVSAINSLFYIIPAIICLLWGSKTAQRSLEEIEAEAASR